RALIGRREEGADAIVLGLGQRDTQGFTTGLEEGVGDLDQDPRAVAGVILAAAGPSMVEVDQSGETIADDLMRAPPLEINDEADAAAIVLVGGVIEALGCRDRGSHRIIPS